MKKQTFITYISSIILAIIVCMPVMSISQEIVNALVMESSRIDPDTELFSGFWRAEDIIDDNGRFYMKIDNCDKNFHSVYDDDFEP